MFVKLDIFDVGFGIYELVLEYGVFDVKVLCFIYCIIFGIGVVIC